MDDVEVQVQVRVRITQLRYLAGERDLLGVLVSIKHSWLVVKIDRNHLTTSQSFA
jgi:hypothetical protein